MQSSVRVYCICLLSILFFFAEAQAATITSAQSGNWNSGSTWAGGVAPGAADNAIVASAHTVSLTTDVTITDFTINMVVR